VGRRAKTVLRLGGRTGRGGEPKPWPRDSKALAISPAPPPQIASTMKQPSVSSRGRASGAADGMLWPVAAASRCFSARYPSSVRLRRSGSEVVGQVISPGLRITGQGFGRLPDLSALPGAGQSLPADPPSSFSVVQAAPNASVE